MEAIIILACILNGLLIYHRAYNDNKQKQLRKAYVASLLVE